MTTKRTPRRSPAGRQLALELTTGAWGTTRLDHPTGDEDGDQLDMFEAIAEATR